MSEDKYEKFKKIDGSHPFKDAVPEGYIDYEAFRREDGEVFYFNFPLAKEMGLLPADHADELTNGLQEAILEAFSLQIINEYDIENNIPIDLELKKKGRYMATRYLQLQHPNKQGKTSGDGRSIWNGYFKGKQYWDITSCGTGATSLSPAVAIQKKNFQTGDPSVSYGCGRSDLTDGVCEVVMSEVLYYNQIRTTRLLAIISFPDDTSINVRVSPNLIRPAHFFHHLKQGNLQRLRAAVDYYIDRQIKNKEYPAITNKNEKYDYLLESVMRDFAEISAQFEIEYIFCWLDWDGDNILMDGTIIDYGSVRQFGLFHQEYRYDDVDKMSTSITEQKQMAKYIVQTFAQLVHYLKKGKKHPIKKYRTHSVMKEFEKVYRSKKEEFLLWKIGFDQDQISKLLKDTRFMKALRLFYKEYHYFEKIKSVTGKYEVDDGVNWDAVFCLRDILREYPQKLLGGERKLSDQAFLEIIRSRYATEEDLELTVSRTRHIRAFQRLYKKMILLAAEFEDVTVQKILQKIASRSRVINRYERLTGDAVIHIANELISTQKKLGTPAIQKMLHNFIKDQVLDPDEKFPYPKKAHRKEKAKKRYEKMLDVVYQHREGI